MMIDANRQLICVDDKSGVGVCAHIWRLLQQTEFAKNWLQQMEDMI